MTFFHPVEQLQLTAGLLDQGRAILYPVPVVAIKDAVDGFDTGFMDMATDQAVDVPPQSFLNGGRFKVIDIANHLPYVRFKESR